MRGATHKLWKPRPSNFWTRVNRNGPSIDYVTGRCWLWSGQIDSRSGYGRVRPTTVHDRKIFATLTAHRVAWELENGPIPANVLVLHRCDNRACVRPSHLFLGDDKINSDDMKKKGRERKAHGEEQHLAKLTEKAVRQIRKERTIDPPTSLQTLANRYGVSRVAVSFAATGKTWKHVDEPVIGAQLRGMSHDKQGRFT